MKIINIVVLLSLISNLSYADCDFSTGIKPNTDGSFTYTKECHLKVGQLVQDNKTKDMQITDLNKAITLKDLALKESEDRASLWMNTSFKLEDRLSKIDGLEKKNDILYFGLGALMVIGTAVAYGQFNHH